MVESVGTSAHAVVRAGELSPATEEEGSSCAGTSAHAAVRAGELSLATKEEGSSCAKGPALCPAADDSADAIGAVGGRDEAVCATENTTVRTRVPVTKKALSLLYILRIGRDRSIQGCNNTRYLVELATSR